MKNEQTTIYGMGFGVVQSAVWWRFEALLEQLESLQVFGGKKMKYQEAKIQCGNCRNSDFELKYTIVDGVKSIIAYCKCGRAIEYRGVQEAIDMTPKVEVRKSIFGGQ